MGTFPFVGTFRRRPNVSVECAHTQSADGESCDKTNHQSIPKNHLSIPTLSILTGAYRAEAFRQECHSLRIRNES
jgi:hypothetical protein